MKRLFIPLLLLAVAWPLSAATKTVTFAVKGWTCGTCAASTRIALKKLEGVEDVKTEAEKSEAVITYEDTKVSPEKMIQAIERLGYKATIKQGATSPVAGSRSSEKSGSRDTPADARGSDPPERVSFFEVPLACRAAEGLGCGSLARPLLTELEGNPMVSEARINHAGTVLAVAWKDPASSGQGGAVVEAAFEKRNLEVAVLRGAERQKALEEFGAERWYRADDVVRLSEQEAQVIASRLVGRVENRLGLPPERIAALKTDLSAAIARHLTGASG
ncbi:MAG: heavy-metal-associated domain-containing protein, partial [Vicinamibacteria bacterium]